MLYKITWKTTDYGNSYVKAHNQKEAREKAIEGEDEDFDREHTDNTWEIDEIHKVEEVD